MELIDKLAIGGIGAVVYAFISALIVALGTDVQTMILGAMSYSAGIMRACTLVLLMPIVSSYEVLVDLYEVVEEDE